MMSAMTPDMPIPLLLDKAGTAERLGIPESTVDSLHRDRKLRGIMVGKSLFWRPCDLTRFVAELEPEK